MIDRVKLLSISEGVVLAITFAIAIYAIYYFGNIFVADKALRELQCGEWVIVATGWGILLEMWAVLIVLSTPFAIMFFFIFSYLVGSLRSKRLRLKRSKSTK